MRTRVALKVSGALFSGAGGNLIDTYASDWRRARATDPLSVLVRTHKHHTHALTHHDGDDGGGA